MRHLARSLVFGLLLVAVVGNVAIGDFLFAPVRGAATAAPVRTPGSYLLKDAPTQVTP
jgi:hypothetical protein